MLTLELRAQAGVHLNTAPYTFNCMYNLLHKVTALNMASPVIRYYEISQHSSLNLKVQSFGKPNSFESSHEFVCFCVIHFINSSNY